MRRIMLLVTVVALMVVMLAMAASAAIAAKATYACTAINSQGVTTIFDASKDEVHQFKALHQSPDTKVRCVKE